MRRQRLRPRRCHAPPLPVREAFRKASPWRQRAHASATRTPARSPSAGRTTSTRTGHLWGAENGNQSARTYRIQVDNDPSFATPIDKRIVDQTTYTAFDKLYPEGTYFWRVQALDCEDHGLTWSAAGDLHEVDARGHAQLAGRRGKVPGTTPFRWAAQAFASTYTVEVYRNNDLTFSAANRVFTRHGEDRRVRADLADPGVAQPYVWRVREQDSSGNPGPWSQTQSFISNGVAPNLLAPKAGELGPGHRRLVRVDRGARRRELQAEHRRHEGLSVTTVATAYAPSGPGSGSYTWSVTAYDGAGKPLATSVTRKYKVDATPPVIKKITPATWKPTTTDQGDLQREGEGHLRQDDRAPEAKGGKQKKSRCGSRSTRSRRARPPRSTRRVT